MLILEKKKHGIVFRTIWYAEQRVERKGINLYRYAGFHIDQPYKAIRTLVSSLEEDEDKILSRISKNGRYEIRRAEKEGIICEIKIGVEIANEDIEHFAEFFCEFWRSKGIRGKSKTEYTKEIEKYVNAGNFAISSARMGEKILVYHTYIVGEDFVRLFQSASQFRTEEEIPRQLVGMANRLLHKEDMFAFKRVGKKIYDWGGAGTREEVASITKFKESFGGIPKELYEWEESIGIKERIVKGIINVLQKF